VDQATNIPLSPRSVVTENEWSPQRGRRLSTVSTSSRHQEFPAPGLSDYFRTLLGDETSADLRLTAADQIGYCGGTRLPGHRLVLARLPFFSRLISAGIAKIEGKTSCGNGDGPDKVADYRPIELAVHGVSEGALRRVLVYAYTDDAAEAAAGLSRDALADLIVAAQTCDLDLLRRACQDILHGHRRQNATPRVSLTSFLEISSSNGDRDDRVLPLSTPGEEFLVNADTHDMQLVGITKDIEEGSIGNHSCVCEDEASHTSSPHEVATESPIWRGQKTELANENDQLREQVRHLHAELDSRRDRRLSGRRHSSGKERRSPKQVVDDTDIRQDHECDENRRNGATPTKADLADAESSCQNGQLIGCRVQAHSCSTRLLSEASCPADPRDKAIYAEFAGSCGNTPCGLYGAQASKVPVATVLPMNTSRTPLRQLSPTRVLTWDPRCPSGARSRESLLPGSFSRTALPHTARRLNSGGSGVASFSPIARNGMLPPAMPRCNTSRIPLASSRMLSADGREMVLSTEVRRQHWRSLTPVGRRARLVAVQVSYVPPPALVRAVTPVTSRGLLKSPSPPPLVTVPMVQPLMATTGSLGCTARAIGVLGSSIVCPAGGAAVGASAGAATNSRRLIGPFPQVTWAYYEVPDGQVT